MSKSFALVNGDLAVDGRSYSEVSGQTKLAQDLKLWILERVGTDPATPTYGSTLDGGTINGVEIPSMIGAVSTKANTLTIQSITQNIIAQYQQMQLAKIQIEMQQYGGQTTLSNDEIIYSINNVKAVQADDTIVVQADITTLAGANMLITIPILT